MNASTPLTEIDYHLLVAEFYMLWSRPPEAARRARMDQMMRLISAFEESRRMASSACDSAASGKRR